MSTPIFGRLRILGCAAIVSLGGVFAFAQTGLSQSASTTPSPTMPPAIVIGFVGGFIKHDDPVHSEVQLAARLRMGYPTGVEVETFESYHGKQARKKVLSLLDTNHDGKLTPEEKQNARIIIYGHSWGGSQAVALARSLEKDGIPVRLTIQVDSISKIRRNDAVIPANVAQAANFYQPNGLLRGQPKIRAANPARTKIIGNFRFDYKAVAYKCGEYPWYDRLFVKSHTQIECDPGVWKQAESLIRSNLPAATGKGDETP
jgi:pimeloyl-ACP methyl ester carboxylesterase